MEESKVALITGGSRGIGRAVAIELAAHGYYAAITYLKNAEAAARSLELIRRAGGCGEALQLDVADAAATEEALEGLLRRLGRIDALVNNAGIKADGLFLTMPRQDWDLVVDTTLKGFYNVTKPVLRRMARKKKGAIVSIASAAALAGNRGQANYAAAKAGLIGASRTVAAEVARLGIRVNVVAPGLIATDMIKDAPVEEIVRFIPMGRLGGPEEVARVVRFLCSDDASYITGQVISVNGGMI